MKEMEKAYAVSYWELNEDDFESGEYLCGFVETTDVIFGEGYTIEDYYSDNASICLELENEHYYFYDADDNKRYVVIAKCNELPPDEAKKFYDSWNN